MVTDQCDRAKLCVSTVLPIRTTSGPVPTLAVEGSGSVRPGEVPMLAWSIDNDCSDLGNIRHAFFLASSNLRYTTVAL